MGDCGTCFENAAIGHPTAPSAVIPGSEILIRQTNRYPQEREYTCTAEHGRKAAATR